MQFEKYCWVINQDGGAVVLLFKCLPLTRSLLVTIFFHSYSNFDLFTGDFHQWMTQFLSICIGSLQKSSYWQGIGTVYGTVLYSVESSGTVLQNGWWNDFFLSKQILLLNWMIFIYDYLYYRSIKFEERLGQP